jgi:hypothetical protein
MSKEIVFAELARIGMALASPKRMELIDLLCQAERSVESLASAIGVSRQRRITFSFSGVPRWCSERAIHTASTGSRSPLFSSTGSNFAHESPLPACKMACSRVKVGSFQLTCMSFRFLSSPRFPHLPEGFKRVAVKSSEKFYTL